MAASRPLVDALPSPVPTPSSPGPVSSLPGLNWSPLRGLIEPRTLSLLETYASGAFIKANGDVSPSDMLALSQVPIVKCEQSDLPPSENRHLSIIGKGPLKLGKAAEPPRLSFEQVACDLSRPSGLARMVGEIDGLLALHGEQADAKDAAKARRKEWKKGGKEGFEPADYQPPEFAVGGGTAHGLRLLRSLVQAHEAINELSVRDPSVDLRQERIETLGLINELAHAISNAYLPKSLNSFKGIRDLAKFAFGRLTQNPGEKPGGPANNLNYAAFPGETDLSKIDPPEGAFWRKLDIASMTPGEIFVGHGRAAVPSFAGVRCTYEEPKEGSGCHAGFRVSFQGPNGEEYEGKVRIGGETSTGATLPRLVGPGGFHVNVIDHVAELNVRYDPKILLEYNSRADKPVTFRGFNGKIKTTIDTQKTYDPLADVKYARLKDGTVVAGEDLRALLYHNPRQQEPWADPSNYRKEAKEKIDTLVFGPVSVEVLDPRNDNIGSTGVNDKALVEVPEALPIALGHKDRRELRGFALMKAWLNLYDVRHDNQRFALRDGRPMFVMHDIGSGLGSGRPPHQNGAINKLGWDDVVEVKYGRNGEPVSVKCPSFVDNEHNEASMSMTYDDARWMARIIAQYSREQIQAALLAGGFPASKVVLYTEKLIARRNEMVSRLGLVAEGSAKLLEVDRAVSFRPELGHQPPSITLPDGSVYTAPVDDNIVVGGKLMRNTDLLGLDMVGMV